MTEGKTLEAERPLLIVDDDPDAHFLLRRALRKVTTHSLVHDVFGGNEAIRYLEKCADGASVFPALVFLDIKMPGVSGFDVLAWLQSRGVLGRLVVLVLSASNDPGDMRRAMSLGAHGCLTKPTGNDMLFEMAQSALKFAGVDANGRS